jgi:transposase-like protein
MASTARTAAQNAPRGIAGNMAELIGRFGTEEACEAHMVALRWPDGFECPRCGCRSYARVAGRREFRCGGCSWQFSATSGTLLAHTRLPLTKWFRAAFMVCSDARGASAQAVARECGVSDLTAHAMLRRLRSAMGWAMRLCVVEGAWVEADAASVPCASSPARVYAPGRAPVMVAVC